MAKNILLDSRNSYYIHDLNLYKNEALIENIDNVLSKISKDFSNNDHKIYFFLVPYASQVTKENCNKKDLAESITIEKLKKYNFETILFKADFCEQKNNLDFYLKHDPAHLSLQGHNFVYKKLKNYLLKNQNK